MADQPDSRRVFIADGARTPFLKAGNGPGPFTPVDLAVWAGRPLLARQPFPASAIDEVILGCVNPHHDEINPGRVSALRLGCGDATPGWTVQRNCASGMQSIDSAFQLVASGRADLVLAGGTEALSHTPLVLPGKTARWLSQWQRASLARRVSLLSELRPSHMTPIISLLRGLTDPICGLNMGQTAEILAAHFRIDRDAQDQYALTSHQRAHGASEQGRFTEVEPIFDRDGNCYSTDDGIRPMSSLESLGKLNAVFDPPYGNVTAGNSSQITDGASWVIVASQAACDQYNLAPMGRIVDVQWAALSPEVMGLGPVYSTTPILQRQGLGLADVDLWEINEAFAAQVLACLCAWASDEFCRGDLGLDNALGSIDQARLNVDGGAIALGHPVGTSGNRIVLHLLAAMSRTGATRGIATECIGGGQGGAMLLERVS